MSRQLFDWIVALLMMRLMVACVLVIAVHRLLAWPQRVLDDWAARPADRDGLSRRNYRKQQSGVRRIRRSRAGSFNVSLDPPSN